MQKFTHSLSFNTLLWWLFLFTNDIFTAYHMINMAALSLPLCTTLKTWYVSQMSRVHVYALKIFFVCRLYSLAFMNTQMPANSKHIFLLVNGKSKNIVRAILLISFFCALLDYFILSILLPSTGTAEIEVQIPVLLTIKHPGNCCFWLFKLENNFWRIQQNPCNSNFCPANSDYM